MAEAEDNSNSMGIIHPPRHIRTIIDKTACLVARWGPEMEKRSMSSYAGQPFFSFFNESDPYHAYYQHRLLESQMEFLKLADSPVDYTGTDPKVLDPAEAEEYKKWLPDGITEEELDLIKRFARSVARFGTIYVSLIRDKPPNRFLEKPTHSTFMFFNTLVAAYWKVMIAPQGLLEKINATGVSMMTSLERELHHLESEKAMSHNHSSTNNSDKEA